MCCSLKAAPVFTFANQAGLDMLETTLIALQDISLEKILDDDGRKALCTEFPKIMQQVWTIVPNATSLWTNPSVMLVTEQHKTVSTPGFRLPPGRRVRVEHGAAGVVRAGGGVEGPERRRHAALPRLHVRQLVIRLRTTLVESIPPLVCLS
jgi:D-serine deaminase-like pyridoxal phosphate-dependent protein